ncbi:hypothetical protein AAFF_G00126840 [Aldrovandia affinis]|uniref:P2X purinoceptor n=1 Tax=Aldrovandia affinis TaxID=143900 RepID=A0AAD7WX99_9TELE|nr:hypothetical protein AAFF_G00126840 [Aldrovandia affinis]
MMTSLTTALSNFFFEYETPRQVLVKDKRVGVVCRLIQLVVLAYIIGWVFLYEKGYQTTDVAIGSVFTKMKGVGYTTVNDTKRVWDVADYVFPDQGDSSFVVMTNYIMTVGQTQDTCPELPGIYNCTSENDCKEGDYKRTGHGHMTGKCVMKTNTCEIHSWCPVENDLQIPDPPLLISAENYTLFIKNSITFPQFGYTRINLVEGVDNNYIRNCIYDQVKDPLCPIFKLGDIVKLSGFTFSQIAIEGGAIGILIDWICDFDWHARYCRPVYNFHGLYGADEAQTSIGYNFRHAKYYVEDKVEKRTLIKVFGIRIDVLFRGLARKFDIIPTLTAIGSGVGIFGVATVVCDLVLLYVLPKRDFYKNMKFKYTTMKEAEPVLQMNNTEKE